MNLTELKSLIVKANDEYRAGTPFISDAEYDVLLAKAEGMMNMVEFEAFKLTLMEAAGDYKHKFVIGSLDKVRAGEGELAPWIKKYAVKSLFASHKLDGMSFVADYANGLLDTGATRGDGITGVDITYKLKHILPNKLKKPFTGTVRGELLLTGNSHAVLELKNRRNGVVGVVKEEKLVMSKISHVKAKVYQILTSTDNIVDQFKEIEALGFETPVHKVIPVTENIEDVLKETFYSDEYDYDFDGVVVSTVDYVNENVAFPKKQIAYKINSDGVACKVIGVEWETSRYRSLKPVILIEPTDIDGATVGRCSGYNAEYIKENSIGIGSVVKIIRSGQVIPKVIDIVEKGALEIPTHCPHCGGKVEWKGVDVRCTNENCGSASVKRVECFVKQLGIENVSEARLKEFGIMTYDELLAWTPKKGSKSQETFYAELLKKLFNNDSTSIMRAFSIDGMGNSRFDKLIEHFGGLTAVDHFIKATFYNRVNLGNADLPAGIAMTTIDKAREDWEHAWNVMKLVLEDSRYVKPAAKEKTAQASSMKLSGKSFLITGTLSAPRKQIEDEIKANGGTLASGVSKTLDFLVCGDKAGSKLDKANKLGIKVISEDDLKGMMK